MTSSTVNDAKAAEGVSLFGSAEVLFPIVLDIGMGHHISPHRNFFVGFAPCSKVLTHESGKQFKAVGTGCLVLKCKLEGDGYEYLVLKHAYYVPDAPVTLVNDYKLTKAYSATIQLQSSGSAITLGNKCKLPLYLKGSHCYHFNASVWPDILDESDSDGNSDIDESVIEGSSSGGDSDGVHSDDGEGGADC